MTRGELVNKIVEQINSVAMESAKINKSAVIRVVDTMFDKVIPTALANNEEIAINDFGKLIPSVREGRTGRNPQSGETIEIEDKVVVKFKASSVLKKRLNG